MILRNFLVVFFILVLSSLMVEGVEGIVDGGGEVQNATVNRTVRFEREFSFNPLKVDLKEFRNASLSKTQKIQRVQALRSDKYSEREVLFSCASFPCEANSRYYVSLNARFNASYSSFRDCFKIASVLHKQMRKVLNENKDLMNRKEYLLEKKVMMSHYHARRNYCANTI